MRPFNIVNQRHSAYAVLAVIGLTLTVTGIALVCSARQSRDLPPNQSETLAPNQMSNLFQRYASLPKPHAQVRPLSFTADVVEVLAPPASYGRDVRDIFAVLPGGAIAPQVGARFEALGRTFAWKPDAPPLAGIPEPVEVPRLDVRFLGRLRPDGFSPAAGWVEIQR